jgi:S1-C subfamily serine protease
MVRVACLSLVALGLAGCGDGGEGTSTATTVERPSVPNSADFLGATLTPTTAGEPGVVVQAVQPDSKTRLKPGDVIIGFNGTPVASPDQLSRAIGTPDLGESFTIKVVRGSHRFTLTEVQSTSAYLGANVRDASGSAQGAVVVSVASDSPAATADMRPGDVITSVDGSSVDSVQDLLQIIGTHTPGDRITMKVSRGSRQLDVAAKLAERRAPGTSR